jgi:hypothetical protein
VVRHLEGIVDQFPDVGVFSVVGLSEEPAEPFRIEQRIFPAVQCSHPRPHCFSSSGGCQLTKGSGEQLKR